MHEPRPAPRGTWRVRSLGLLALLMSLPAPAAALRQAPGSVPPFQVEEATIASVHAALAAGRLTCEALVRAYLDRIDAYDDRGPALNAVLAVNPRALDQAREMDRRRRAGEPTGSLHCIPVLVKDNYDTADMPTTAGSLTLATSRPPDDAFTVRRLREAEALVIAKTNLTELALGGTTVSSLGGQTRNPYDLTRTPGGSSGGTGAALAADFGLLGTGSDTGQSIRSPASAQCLVGLRPTRGLVSRDGIVPLSTTQDEGGPITRTVEDAARMLDVLAGYDPADPVTALSHGRIPDTYTALLRPDGLRGSRIGVLDDLFGDAPVHAEVNAVTESALRVMEGLGATLVRIRIPGLAELTADVNVMDFEMVPALDAYLTSLGPGAPVRSVAELVARGEYTPAVGGPLEAGLASGGLESSTYRRRLLRRDELRRALMKAMADHDVDALLYPHQKRLVAPIGEDQLERNGVLSHGTGFPALTFQGGFSAPTPSAPLGVPVGIELLGPDWSEPVLLRMAYAFEQATRLRRPPASTPPLP